MRRGSIFVLIFIVIAAAVVGISLFLQSRPPVVYMVAVNPLAADWVRAAVTDLNETDPIIGGTQPVQFNVLAIDDVAVWSGNPGWSPQDHPAAWIPAAGASVDYSGAFQVDTATLAQTLLVWGGYESRVAVATRGSTYELDWNAVQLTAEAEAWASIDGGQEAWRFVKLAFPRADQAMSGVAVLFSAAGNYAARPEITGVVRDSEFRDWLEPVIASVPSFQTLGADPAAAVARGPSTAEIALLPESQWLLHIEGLTTSTDPIRFRYPAHQFVFDFPLATWAGATEDPLEAEAVALLRDWLLAEARQDTLAGYGLRPAQGDPPPGSTLFEQAEPLGIARRPVIEQQVTAPPRGDVQSLIQWFVNIRR
jgi:hypothetical protein